MFARIDRKSGMKANWIAVNTPAMSVNHEPKTDFERRLLTNGGSFGFGGSQAHLDSRGDPHTPAQPVAPRVQGIRPVFILCGITE